MSERSALTEEERGLVKRCREYRGLPVMISTWFYWTIFALGAAALAFGLLAPLVRWASAGVVPAWDHLLSGAFAGAMLLWFWWGITQQAAQAHKLAVLVDKLADASPLAAPPPKQPVGHVHVEQGAAADRPRE
jgi:hypothetical protein